MDYEAAYKRLRRAVDIVGIRAIREIDESDNDVSNGISRISEWGNKSFSAAIGARVKKDTPHGTEVEGTVRGYFVKWDNGERSVESDDLLSPAYSTASQMLRAAMNDLGQANIRAIHLWSRVPPKVIEVTLLKLQEIGFAKTDGFNWGLTDEVIDKWIENPTK